MITIRFVHIEKSVREDEIFELEYMCHIVLDIFEEVIVTENTGTCSCVKRTFCYERSVVNPA
jgi:hypothetical protein